jgi:hypothetical protein
LLFHAPTVSRSKACNEKEKNFAVCQKFFPLEFLNPPKSPFDKGGLSQQFPCNFHPFFKGGPGGYQPPLGGKTFSNCYIFNFSPENTFTYLQNRLFFKQPWGVPYTLICGGHRPPYELISDDLSNF